ncbi:hypothetical protein [Spongiactinospora sp. 9N601]
MNAPRRPLGGEPQAGRMVGFTFCPPGRRVKVMKVIARPVQEAAGRLSGT